jgi:hypothetical protein
MQERIESGRQPSKPGQTPDMGRARYFFESLAEMGAWIERTPRTWACNDSVSAGAYTSWDLGAGYDSAVSMAKGGWMDGAQRSQKALEALKATVPEPRQRVDFVGFRPHVQRQIAGDIKCMVRKVKVRADNGKGRVVTLIVPVNATAWVGAEAMANFGVAVAQYVNQMERQRIRVEVIAAMTSKVSGWRVSACVRIKHASQPLDLAVMAFAIGHPAMFRRLGFAIRERCHAPMDTGYGRTVATREDDVINAPQGAIVLNGMADADEHARTPADGVAYVTRTLDAARGLTALGAA